MPALMPFEEIRHGAVTDCCGNQWYVATHVEDVPPEEMDKRAKAARG